VLSERAYRRLLDKSLPVAQRLKHFANRQEWLRFFGSAYQQRINDNVARWHQVGIVAELPGPEDHAELGLPDRFWVETGLSEQLVMADPTWSQVLIAEGALAAPDPDQIHRMAAAHQEQQAQVAPGQGRRTLRRDEL
jgi:hypothetical protein